MRIKLSRRFNLYVGGILFAGMTVLIVHNTISNERLLREIGSDEAQRLAATTFEQLYTSMKLGGGRAENHKIISKMNSISGVNEIRIIHATFINEQYGPEDNEAAHDDYDRAGLDGKVTNVIEEDDGVRYARYVMPVYNRSECVGCHGVAPGRILGVISARISLKKYDTAIAGHTINFLIWSFLILGSTSLAIVLSVRNRFLRPIERLKEGAEALASGDLAHRVRLRTEDELEDLSSAFDNMAANLLTATKELKATNSKYSQLVETALDGILLKDIEKDAYVDANRAATELSGYSKDELLSLGADELFREDTKVRYKDSFERWKRDGTGYLIGGAVVGKKGDFVPVEIAASVININGGLHMLEIWRDITERSGLEDALRHHVNDLEATVRERTSDLNHTLREREEAYRKLQASEQKLVQSAKLISLGEMGAGIAHELNSPIAGILSITEVLLGRLSRDDQNYFLLEKIKDASVRSRNIILDMLSYSRPFKGDFVRLDMNDVVRATLNLFASEMKTSSININNDFGEGLPAVMGNKGQLMEVFLNIIKNARDAMDGKGAVFINSRSSRLDDREMVTVEIRDTGPGIPAEVMGRIFEPFFSTKEKGGGMNIGLGLAVSQTIVKTHGGVIEVESKPGEGATFKVSVPVAPQTTESGHA